MCQVGAREENFICNGEDKKSHTILVPKIKIEVVGSDSFADKIVECIVKEGKTGNGQEGDGVIFISNVDEAVNIATSAKGEQAIFHSS